MSSESHRMPRVNAIRYEDFSPKPAGYWSLLAYNRSKFANMLHMNHLSRQLVDKELSRNFHLGRNYDTNLVRFESTVIICH